MKKYLTIVIILTLLVIDWLEFHDLFESKTLPEYFTVIVSVPIIILMGMDLFRKKN